MVLSWIGIVTHMTLRTYSAGRVWGGTLIYNSNPSFQDDLMSAFATYQEVGQLDTKSALITDMGINNDTLILTLVYFGSVERPAAFRPFFEIPARLDLTRLHNNFTDLVNQQANQVVPR
jgi:hypothetical protein